MRFMISEPVPVERSRLLDRFALIVTRLQQILEQFLDNLHCMDVPRSAMQRAINYRQRWSSSEKNSTART